MKEQILKITASLKERFNVEHLEITADFTNNRLWVNGVQEQADEFLKAKQVISMLIKLKYGISNIDFLKLTDTDVTVYYIHKNQKQFKVL